AGTVEIQQGAVNLTGGGAHTGSFRGATGTTLQFGGSHTFEEEAKITGDMNVAFVAAAEMAGPVTLSTTGTSSLSGAVTGSGNWNITSNLTWTGGGMLGSGVTTIAPNATLSLGGSSARHLRRLLVNEGTATWTSGSLAF